MSMKQLNIILAICTLIVSFFFWKSASTIVGEAGTYPKALIALMAFFAVCILLQALFFKKDDKNQKPFANIKWFRVGITIIVTVLYYFSAKYIGFYSSSFIYIILLSLILEKKRTAKTVVLLTIISLVVTIIIYLAFGIFLRVSVPKGLLF